MTQAQYEEATKLGEEVLRVLHEAFLTGDPAGELAQKAADLHRQWLGYFWDHYSKEAHAGLAQMYVDDERFKAYYDQNSQEWRSFFVTPFSFTQAKVGRHKPVFLHCKRLKKMYI